MPDERRTTQLLSIIALSVCLHTAYTGCRVAVPLLALRSGADAMTVGVLASLFTLVPALSATHTGRLLDRVGLRLPIIVAALVSTAGALLGAMWPLPGTMVMLAPLVGGGAIFVHLAVTQAVGAYGAAADRTRNFSLLSLGYSVSSFAGPLIAGFAIESLGFRATFALLAVFPLLAALLVCGGVVDWHRGAALAAPAVPRRMADLLRVPALRKVLFIAVMLSSATEIFSLAVPLHGTAIGLSAASIGGVIGAFAAGTMLVRLLLPMVAARLHEWVLLAAALFVAVGVYAAFPLVAAVEWLALLAFVMGVGLGLSAPIVLSLLYSVAPADRVNEAAGLRLAAVNANQTAMPMLFGAVGSAVGLALVFWGFAALLGLAGIAAQRERRRAA